MVQFRRNLSALLIAALAVASHAQVAAPSPFMRMLKPTATEETLQTKARKYSPADGKGPDIWLVGVAHVGQADYYKKIQKLLDDQTTVLYEGVTRKGADPANTVAVADPKDDPRMRSSYQVLSDALHLQFQLFGIDYKRPSFHNADLSWEEMAALEAKGPKSKGGMSLANIGDVLNANSEQGKQLAAVLGAMKDDPSSIEAMHLIMVETLSNPDAMSLALSPGMNDLLIKTRNAKVLSSLKSELAKEPAQKSIAIFFGAGHMFDMEQHLTKDLGYVPGEERWFSAIDGDSKKVTSPNGQMMLQMMRASLVKKKGGF